MTAGDRRLAGLLLALFLAFGLGGAAHGGGTPGDGHPIVAATSGAQGPQAVLDLHSQPRLAQHPGTFAGPAAALVAALLLGRWRRSSPARSAARATARPAHGSRAPPVISTPA